MHFNDQFKTFRNILRNLNKPQLIIAAAQRLHEIEGLSPGLMRGTYPWHLLLLIRWSIEHENKYSYYPHDIDYNVFARLINMIQELEVKSHQIFFAEEEQVYGLAKFLRTIAFQQFWLQNSRGKWDLARQLILLGGNPENHPIAHFFSQHIGLTIDDFLTLTSIIWVWCVEDRKHLSFKSDTLFSNTIYDQKTIDAYFRLLSRNAREMQEYLTTRKQGVKNPFLQFAEQTPFVRYPFLKIGDTYMVYARRVLEETIASMLYDEIKSSNNSMLINHFADNLERYVETCLGAGVERYYTEIDLRNNFPSSKVTDFLIPLGECTVLLEVKAVDLRSTVKVYPENKSLINELEDSVVKAVIQGYHTARRIAVNNDKLNIPNRSRFFLLIVTYRQLYMGFGKSVWEEFLRDAVASELGSEGLDEQIIEPDRIIILSIEELELLMGILWEKKATLSQILESVVVNNAAPESSKLLFIQHFEEHIGDDPSFPLLDDVFERFWNDASKKFIKNANP